jgi:membrane protein DedA with SNARE-associated domain
VHTHGVPAVIIKGATPIPFKVVTIAAGVAKMNLPAFIGASIIARAMRFYLVAGLLYFFGEPIRDFIERRLALVTTVFVVVLVGGFVAIRYLV